MKYEISVEHFQDWLHYVQNQSKYHLTFTYWLLEKNNSANAVSMRIQFAPLFHSFCHPKYQQLHLLDLYQRVQMSERLKSVVGNTKVLYFLENKMLARGVILFMDN